VSAVVIVHDGFVTVSCRPTEPVIEADAGASRDALAIDLPAFLMGAVCIPAGALMFIRREPLSWVMVRRKVLPS
jgi:hypothetical protein